MSEPCCADCRHMMEKEQDGERFLVCARYPPTQIATLEGAMSSWPVIDPDDRCGEFQQRAS